MHHESWTLCCCDDELIDGIQKRVETEHVRRRVELDIRKKLPKDLQSVK